MRRDFPGATSVSSAARVAPVRFGVHVARDAATAVEVAAAALTPERLGGWKGAAVVAALALAVASAWARRRGPLPRGVGWLALGLAATSSGALLVVPQGRHVLGLSLAMLFLLAAATWATAPRPAPFLTVAGVLTLVSAHTLARVDPGPQTVRRLVARARARPGPIVVVGAGAFCFCAYLDACEPHEDPSAGGKGEHERDCAAVALAPSYFTSSIAPSRPPCVTAAYERIAVNPEVWERR